VLEHEAGFESLYLHLSEVEPDVVVGAMVEGGQVIAKSGNTGRSTGPHLHYELHLDGTALDPLALLPPPTTALGPLAEREHRAFINQLEAIP
jgi:murein DD-endopeptidase MepM/ murein hydrolase activator NlpD